MHELTTPLAQQTIQAILTPALMISACGLLLLGLNNRYAIVISRIRMLNDEKRRKLADPEGIDREEITTSYDMLVFGKDEEKLSYTLANCCNPIPGDEVFGFVTVKDGIKVHKKDCPNAISLQSNYAYRIISAKWIDSSQEEFTAEIRLSGIDTLGLINSITEIISDEMHVNMRNINFNTDGGTFNGSIKLVVKNKSILKKLIQNLKRINGIDKVTRI